MSEGIQGYHIVLTTHNSRTSQRMIKYKVRKGPPLELDLNEEIVLTQIIADIIIENEYRCAAYNICKDHVHMILVCEFEKLFEIVKVIKGKSSFLYQKAGYKKKGVPLWSQKFFKVDLDVWKLAVITNRVGYAYGESHLNNALVYIKNNRIKHCLQQSKELRDIIESFKLPLEKAFFIR